MKNVQIYDKNGLKKKIKKYVIIGTSVIAVVGTVTKCAKKSKEDVFLDNYENSMTKIRVESLAENEKDIQDFYETIDTGYLTQERFEKAFKKENDTEKIEEGETALIPVLLDSKELNDLTDYLSREKNIHVDINQENYDNFIMNESDYQNFANYESYQRIPIETNYTVQNGEWLEEIAAKFKTSVSKITYADGTKVPNKNFILGGEVLKIKTYEYVLAEMENEVIAQNRASR